MIRAHRPSAVRAAILLACCLAAAAAAQELTLPNQPDSVKFAVIGDMGTGDKPQIDTMGGKKYFTFIRCIPRAARMDPRSTCANNWSRCSLNTTSASCSPATNIFTSA